LDQTVGWEVATGYPNKSWDMVQDPANLYQYGRDKVVHFFVISCDRVLIH
jgi:hypothetical protein